MLQVDFATQNQKIVAIGSSWDDEYFSSYPNFRTYINPENPIKYHTFTFFNESEDVDAEEGSGNDDGDRRKKLYRFQTDLARTLDMEWLGSMAICPYGMEEFLGKCRTIPLWSSPPEQDFSSITSSNIYNDQRKGESLTPWKQLCHCPEPAIWHYKGLAEIQIKFLGPNIRNCQLAELQDMFQRGDAKAGKLLAQVYRHSLSRREALICHQVFSESPNNPNNQSAKPVKCIKPNCQEVGKPNINCVGCLSSEEIKKKYKWELFAKNPQNYWCAKCIANCVNDESLIVDTHKDGQSDVVTMNWPEWLDLRCEKCRK